jgi:hypothetical protein
MYYDRDGNRLTLWQWAAIMESRQDRHVADDMVGMVRVSTVWLGLDHNFSGLGPPLIYETMIFGGTMDERQWRYPTAVSALAGHDRVLMMVRAAEEQLALTLEHTLIGIKYYLDVQK